MASTFVRVQVVFEMEHDCGPWGDEATAGKLRKIALDEARDAASRVVHAAAKEARVRLRVASIGDSVSIVTRRDEKEQP